MDSGSIFSAWLYLFFYPTKKETSYTRTKEKKTLAHVSRVANHLHKKIKALYNFSLHIFFLIFFTRRKKKESSEIHVCDSHAFLVHYYQGKGVWYLSWCSCHVNGIPGKATLTTFLFIHSLFYSVDVARAEWRKRENKKHVPLSHSLFSSVEHVLLYLYT